MMETDLVVTGNIGATPKTKEKLGAVVFLSFPLYIHYIDSLQKPAVDGTKVMVFLRDKMARDYLGKIDIGMRIKVTGVLTRSHYIDDSGVTRPTEAIWADNLRY